MSARLDHGEDDLVENHDINVTPFIDVMLVLLIIFMVVAPLATTDVPVDLPGSDGAASATSAEAASPDPEGRSFAQPRRRGDRPRGTGRSARRRQRRRQGRAHLSCAPTGPSFMAT